MKYEDLEDMKSRQEALNTSSDDETGSSSLSSSDEEKNESDEELDGEVLPYELPLEDEVQAVFENFQHTFARTVELLDEAIENKDRDMEEIEEEWDENRLIDKYNKLR